MNMFSGPSPTVGKDSPIAKATYGTALRWKEADSQESFFVTNDLIQDLTDTADVQASAGSNGPLRGRVVRLPVIPAPEPRYQVLQQWEGTVSEIVDGDFRAELRDLTDPSHPDEVAVFSLDEVSDPDRSLVALGAIFYWTICYEITRTKQKKTVSLIRFQRLPAWTQKDIRAIKKKAEELKYAFGEADSHTDAAAG